MAEPVELVTFGEAMLRLSAPGQERLEQATSFRIHVGGGRHSSGGGRFSKKQQPRLLGSLRNSRNGSMGRKGKLMQAQANTDSIGGT